jgi:DNA-binding transcriptional LysR family regulator
MLLITVVDHCGFGKAAEQLMVAQSSLSQAIAGFERELGMPLFHRVEARPCTPTAAVPLFAAQPEQE